MSTDDFASNQLPVSRKEALATGQTHFFTGKPCIRGHIAPRFASSPKCVQCGIEHSKSWRDLNPDKIAEQNARWNAENYERRLELNMIWNHANPSKIREQNQRQNAKPDAKIKRKANYDKNPRPAIVAAANRRAKRKMAEGTYTDDDIAVIRKAQKDKCAMCKVKLLGKGHVDHIIALVKGGSNWPRNLQLLCQPCNCSKKDRHPIVFAQSRGLLL